MSQLNGDQARHVNAFNKLGFFFGENEVVFSKDVAFAKWVERLLSNNKKIAPLSTIKGINGEGATEKKVDLKAVIAQAAGFICSYAADYAVETGDTDLFNIVNYTESSVYRLRDAEIIGFVGGIITAVTPLLSDPGFEDYPVTIANLDKLAEDAAAFNNDLGKNKLINNKSSVASGNIDEIIKENRNIINRLDKLVNNFKTKTPDFVAGYFKAKLISNTGIHHSGIRAVIKDSTGAAVIEDAIITLTSKKSIKTAIMSGDGAYTIIKCIAGSWKLTVAAPGYETQVTDVKIIRGVVQKLEIRMQAKVLEMPEIQTA